MPINDNQFWQDVVHCLDVPVVLVVGLRLGCINHALLSAAVIGQHARLHGWIANHIDPAMAVVGENLATLHAHMPCPCLG